MDMYRRIHTHIWREREFAYIYICKLNVLENLHQVLLVNRPIKNLRLWESYVGIKRTANGIKLKVWILSSVDIGKSYW